MVVVVAASAALRAPAAPGYGAPIQLGEVGSDGFHRSWIMLFPFGKYEHPQYGDLNFNRTKLAEIKRLFDARARHIDIALDANHDQDKATGWLEALDLREPAGPGAPGGLWGKVRWTKYGAQLIEDQIYRYFSPEFGPWEDPKSGKKYDDLLIGGGLTNRPFLKDMPAVTLAEVSNTPWGSVKKSCLPRSCFLDQGDPNDKSTWRLPVYEGAGAKDAQGHYTKRGPLNINGVRAALAAIGGAHTGTAMTGLPSGIQAKLQGWLKQYGGTSSSDRQASEVRGMGRKYFEDEESQMLADSDNESDDGETYDDGSGDDGNDDGSDGVDSESDTHGAFDGRHKHGKYAMHMHDGDGDHSDAPMAGKSMSGGGKKAREPRMQSSKALREAYEEQGRQLAEMREQMYKAEVAKTIEGWDAGKFQFAEPRKGAPTGKVAASKVFVEDYRDFMLGDAAELPAKMRARIGRLIEKAWQGAVDLSEKSVSYDQEKRGRFTGKSTRDVEGADTLEEAQRLSESRYHKSLDKLPYDEQLALLSEVSGSN